MIVVKNVNDIDIKKWSEFVFKNEKGSIFQTPQMYKVFLDTKNYSPQIVMLIGRDSDILGLLQSVNIQSNFLRSYNLFSRSIISGGPILGQNISDSEVIDLLLARLSNNSPKNIIYTQIRNHFSQKKLHGFFLKNGYKHLGHLNYLVDLGPSEDKLWQKISKNRRKGISRAINRNELEYKEIDDSGEIPEVYRILKKTYSRVGLPIADISHFYSIFKNLVPINNSKFFGIKFEGKMVACRVILTYKKLIYDYYCGYDPEFSKKYPNEFLVWKIWQWGIKNKYTKFDFGGAGSPDKFYGPREFKRRFGGELVNFGRFELSNNFWGHKLLRLILKVKERF